MESGSSGAWSRKPVLFWRFRGFNTERDGMECQCGDEEGRVIPVKWSGKLSAEER